VPANARRELRSAAHGGHDLGRGLFERERMHDQPLVERGELILIKPGDVSSWWSRLSW
jgi:hypothetical protein